MNEIALEDRVRDLKRISRVLPQMKLETRHFLCDGMYTRQILIPAGTAFVGRKQRKQHYFMCLAGGAWIIGPDEKPINVRAGMVLIGSTGEARIGLTYLDTVFATVHRTEQTDLDTIVNECTEFDPDCEYGVGNEPLQRMEVQ